MLNDTVLQLLFWQYYISVGGCNELIQWGLEHVSYKPSREKDGLMQVASW